MYKTGWAPSSSRLQCACTIQSLIFKPGVEVLNLAVLVVLPCRGVTLIVVCAGNSVGFELVQLLRNFHDDCACLQVGAGCLVLAPSVRELVFK